MLHAGQENIHKIINPKKPEQIFTINLLVPIARTWTGLQPVYHAQLTGGATIRVSKIDEQNSFFITDPGNGAHHYGNKTGIFLYDTLKNLFN